MACVLPKNNILRASGVAHASHLVAVTDRQEQGRGCIKEESGAVGEGLLLGGPWGSKVDCWSLMESGSCSKICDILWKLQVGQAVHEDPTTTTKVISIHGYSQRQRRGAYDEGFANKGVIVNYPVC